MELWNVRTNVHVLPVDFGWNDLGTWGSLYNKLEKDNQQNATVGAQTIFRDANGNMIRTQNGKASYHSRFRKLYCSRKR